MLFVLLSLNAWSSSKIDNCPVDARSCPTGKDVFPRSDKALRTVYSIALSEISTTSLGDISIKSNVESNLFIVSTTTLIPRRYENSLYTVFPVTALSKEIGDVKSVTKLV